MPSDPVPASSKDSNRRPVASLWIGPRLHYINQLCLLSHVQQGHPTTLYCTEPVSNVPEGVIVRPASEIMPVDLAVVQKTSESFISNVFRYKMIQATDAVWIDCDAFCHRPFPDEMSPIFAGHGFRGALNCGVVYIPPKGELMAQLLDYYENLPDYPGWFNKQQRKKLDKQDSALPQAVRIYNAERTAFGPQAFTWFAQKTSDYEKALGSDVLYPVPFQLNDIFFDPHGRVEGHFTEQTLSVHLYTNGTKPWWRKNPPLANSYAARMCEKIGVLPGEALEE
jgi:hypothetical protein